jgi:N-carbamoyl-L-amino-acid hydrolase
VRRPKEVAAYLELHIEQGGILDSRKIHIGIVEGIVGIQRWDVRIEGFANHAGTTPMSMRQDALLAAARFVIAVEGIVTNVPGTQVGTVGRIRVEPGAVNVIPGLAVLSLELRDLSEEKIRLLFGHIQKEAKAIEERTGTKVTFSSSDSGAAPALTNLLLQKAIADAAGRLGLSTLRLPSGAGHDAQNMARIAPMGMIFIPSVGGISHSPREFSRPEDLANGANALLQTILLID